MYITSNTKLYGQSKMLKGTCFLSPPRFTCLKKKDVNERQAMKVSCLPPSPPAPLDPQLTSSEASYRYEIIYIFNEEVF